MFLYKIIHSCNKKINEKKKEKKMIIDFPGNGTGYHRRDDFEGPGKITNAMIVCQPVKEVYICFIYRKYFFEWEDVNDGHKIQHITGSQCLTCIFSNSLCVFRKPWPLAPSIHVSILESTCTCTSAKKYHHMCDSFYVHCNRRDKQPIIFHVTLQRPLVACMWPHGI